MKKTIIITIIITILVVLTGAIIWLFPGADDTVCGREKRDFLCEVTRDVETTTTTATTTAPVHYSYAYVGDQFIPVD